MRASGSATGTSCSSSRSSTTASEDLRVREAAGTGSSGCGSASPSTAAVSTPAAPPPAASPSAPSSRPDEHDGPRRRRPGARPSRAAEDPRERAGAGRRRRGGRRRGCGERGAAAPAGPRPHGHPHAGARRDRGHEADRAGAAVDACPRPHDVRARHVRLRRAPRGRERIHAEGRPAGGDRRRGADRRDRRGAARPRRDARRDRGVRAPARAPASPGGATRGRRAHAARAGGARPARARALEPRDLRSARDQRGDGEDARGADPPEARPPRPRAGRDLRVRERARRPRDARSVRRVAHHRSLTPRRSGAGADVRVEKLQSSVRRGGRARLRARGAARPRELERPAVVGEQQLGPARRRDVRRRGRTTGGTVWAWGDNSSGELGPGAAGTPYSTTPVAVTGLCTTCGGVVQLASGENDAFALFSDGSIESWGKGTSGALGDGKTASTSQPQTVRLGGTGVAVAVAAGGQHAVALMSDGTVESWGQNHDGQLGDGTTASSKVPVPVSGITNAVAVSAANLYSMALLADGSVVAWGYNAFGQLGDGTTTDRSIPVSVTGLDQPATAISAGGNLSSNGHSMALLADGTVATWGCNAGGELGDGTLASSSAPVLANGVTGAIAVSAGGA